ncbi:MAG: OmpA family protein [Pseudomonadota bacterium]|nr:OmpA family protein [Pseudomonadota bacterium]
MNRTNLSLLLTIALLGACAPKVPPELSLARGAYAQASAGPAATLVPAELHKAHEALGEAETAFKDDPRGYHTKDLAYVAQRKAELAEALAASASESKSADASNSQYQTTQDAIMRDTKAQLGETKSDLAATQTVAARTAEQLTASEAAGAKTTAQLTASEAARAQAEARAAEAMAALAKLAAVKEETRGLVITLSGSVLFRSDESNLLPEAQTRLGQVTDALMATKERSILIEGHTDSQGTDADNIGLSQRRAEAVRTFLTARGYDAARIRAVGVGESRPVADNASPEGRANNRRVEIIVEPGTTASQ